MKVFVAASGKRKSNVYHTTECSQYPSNPRPMDQEMAEGFGYSECGHCAGWEQKSSSDFSYQAALKKEAAKHD